MTAPSVLERLAGRARAEPDRLFAHLFRGERWEALRYGDLWARTGRFAGLCRRRGVIAGDVVFVVLRPGPELYAAFLGVMLAGGVPSLLPYPSDKQQHAAYWDQHARLFLRVRPRAVICERDLVEAMRACAGPSGAVIVAPGEAMDARAVEDLPALDRDKPLLLQHSSGTTGLKKGVILSARQIGSQAAGYARSLSWTEDDVVASWLPLYHDMGLMTAFLIPLIIGSRIVTLDPFAWASRPASFLEAVQTHQATLGWLPNFAFLHIARASPKGERFDLSSLRALVNCSEPCRPDTFDAFLARFSACGVGSGTLQTCYAMAETAFAVTQSRVGEAPRRLSITQQSLEQGATVIEPAPGAQEPATSLLSNGWAIDRCAVRIQGDGVIRAEREIGEVHVAADFLSDGYYQNASATREAFVDGWYRTGDLGFIDAGELFVTGRIKDLIIISGRNIYAHDVEAALVGIDGLKPGRAVALGVHDAAMGSQKLIVIAEVEDAPGDSTALKSRVNRSVLEAVGVPCSHVELVPRGWLVKTTSGKVSRSENMKKLGFVL